MPKLVKQIHDLISLAIDKGYTQYIPDADIDNVIDQEQMVLFRQLIKQFPKDKRVRNDLLPFECKANITITAKVGDLPSNLEQEIEFWHTASGVDYPVQVEESGFFRRRIRDVVDPPSTTNVFATIYNNSGRKIEVSPQVSPITALYFKTPTKPVYGTTASNSQYIYDDTASTDVLWRGPMQDILVEKTLSFFGLNMRDGILIRTGQPKEPKEMTV